MCCPGPLLDIYTILGSKVKVTVAKQHSLARTYWGIHHIQCFVIASILSTVMLSAGNNLDLACNCHRLALAVCDAPVLQLCFSYAILLSTGNDSVEGVELLVRHNADVNIMNTVGITPMMKICSTKESEHMPEIVQLLIKGGANIDARDFKSRRTALHVSVS